MGTGAVPVPAVAGGAGCRQPRGAQSPFELLTEELLIPGRPSEPGMATAEEKGTLDTQGNSGSECPPGQGQLPTGGWPQSEP